MMQQASRLCTSTAARALVELERKFVPTKDIIEKLRILCPIPQTKHFVDVYWDTAAFSLSLKDCWLRQRGKCHAQLGTDTLENLLKHSSDDGITFPLPASVHKLEWEIKIPSDSSAADVAPRDSSHITKYLELREEKAILQAVRNVLSAANEFKDSASDTRHCLQALGVRPWGSLLTQRTTYSLQHSGVCVNVDIDNVLFDRGGSCSIGEMEVMAEQDDEGRQAEVLKEMWQLMSFPNTAVPGKVLTYFAQHEPQHYHALRSAGFLAAKGL